MAKGDPTSSIVVTPAIVGERRAQLRDGRSAVIRPMRVEDIAGIMLIDREITEAGLGAMRTIGEMNRSPEEMLERMRPFLDGQFSGLGGVEMVAEVDGEPAGGVNAKRYDMARLRHNAWLGLGVRPRFQGLGLGRALMFAIIDWAKETQRRDPPGVTRLELCTIGDNVRAIRLYESLGFVHEGKRIGKVRDPDGRMRDDLEMAMWV